MRCRASALIGASNFFELAVAAAISLFGFKSGAALATVVGVLIEVPVMLTVVKIVTATHSWYDARSTLRFDLGPKDLSSESGLDGGRLASFASVIGDDVRQGSWLCSGA